MEWELFESEEPAEGSRPTGSPNVARWRGRCPWYGGCRAAFVSAAVGHLRQRTLERALGVSLRAARLVCERQIIVIVD